jgi:hypothetical protein
LTILLALFDVAIFHCPDARLRFLGYRHSARWSLPARLLAPVRPRVRVDDAAARPHMRGLKASTNTLSGSNTPRLRMLPRIIGVPGCDCG